MHEHLSCTLSRLSSSEPITIVRVSECLRGLHPIHLYRFRTRLTDVPFAVSGNASADGTKRHRTGELISCPELGDLRTPVEGLKEPTRGTGLDPMETSPIRPRCNAAIALGCCAVYFERAFVSRGDLISLLA